MLSGSGHVIKSVSGHYLALSFELLRSRRIISYAAWLHEEFFLVVYEHCIVALSCTISGNSGVSV
ncbi:uncharacterized protein SPAPADRAFT_61153 [Spathaspora passalidarum NRRL Y-27907]|uniref:Uncharacterized protein n=1 Tax=Spathaspora passalidarum (strain NRRL Y-27907 / 11-Y1) TaxID=619300 RepID=G3AP34_SPAPN|nr:uncharacterized protein SPAPADRAFT_61153 [Spathaspora passalidarum NRRL Y-27907]EGW32065.1 hypothetical protein SPAPADRAFT_61153 [Spathaspora passalidarum NRRL Y-27907]